jgi:protein gp37
MANAWIPWYGCKKKSEGCQNCYIYRGAASRGMDASNVHKSDKFDLPLQMNTKGNYIIPPNTLVFTSFSSDFLLEEADEWRLEAWAMMKQRSDCKFLFLTKRPERLLQCIPPDWNGGYDNVEIGVSCENQRRADERLSIFMKLPIKRKYIILAPMLEKMDIEKYLDPSLACVVCEGESGPGVRPLEFDWVLDIREQCIRRGVSFSFRQTGSNFIMDGKPYQVQKRYQHSQARKAGIDYSPVSIAPALPILLEGSC